MAVAVRICARCPTRLSRYNRDDLCAPCWEKQRAERGLRPVRDTTLVRRNRQRCPDSCDGFLGDYCKRCRFLIPDEPRICSTPDCGKALSSLTAGDRCRACYESQSVAGQQRALKETKPVMVAQRDQEKVTTVERERVTITASEGSVKTVVLKGGGSITVNIVADLFCLTAPDRELVLGLVDALNAFEQGRPPPSFHHCACEHYQAAVQATIDVSKGAEYCMVCAEELEGGRHKPGCAQAVLEAAGVGQ